MTQLVWGSLSMLAALAAVVLLIIGGHHFAVIVALLFAIVLALWTIAPKPRVQLPPPR